MAKKRCPNCGGTQIRFLKSIKKFTCYSCDGDDWDNKEEEDIDG